LYTKGGKMYNSNEQKNRTLKMQKLSKTESEDWGGTAHNVKGKCSNCGKSWDPTYNDDSDKEHCSHCGAMIKSSNKKELLVKISKAADELEELGFDKEASALTKVMQKIAQMPAMGTNAVPFREILSEKKGIYAFEYQIKGKKTGFFKDNLALRIFDVKDIISTNIKDIPLNSTKVEMTIRNRENITINNLKITAKSNFFEFADTFNIKNNEDKVIQIPITLDRKISAGD
jgi:hypothetical protein